MDENILCQMAFKLNQLSQNIDFVEQNLSHIRDVKDELVRLVETEAERLGIDPYEVKDF